MLPPSLFSVFFLVLLWAQRVSGSKTPAEKMLEKFSFKKRWNDNFLNNTRIGHISDSKFLKEQRIKATSNGWASHNFYKKDDCGGATIYQYGYPLDTCFLIYDDNSNDDDAENEVPIGSVIFKCDEEGGNVNRIIYKDTECQEVDRDESADIDKCVNEDMDAIQSYSFTCTTKSIYPVTDAREYAIKTGYTEEDCTYRVYQSYTEAFQANFCLSVDGAGSMMIDNSLQASFYENGDCNDEELTFSEYLSTSCDHNEINDDDEHKVEDEDDDGYDGEVYIAEVWSYQYSSKHYYDNIDFTATDDELKGQLKALINPHTVYDYDSVWDAFPSIDVYLPGYPCDPDNSSHIPDIYSSYCWDPEKDVPQGECGNYQKEGDCFNREHVWPKSWFGGFDYGENAQTDLFELWPSDGYVNGLRGNLPFGYVDRSTVTYTSTSGCVIGDCDSDEYDGQCFEVADILKGDLARSYFYLSTAYWNEWSCCDEAGVNGSDIKPWMESVLRQWHANDPVDSQEISRNDEIFFDWQHNRNPFIDYPEWVDQISDF